MKISILVGLVSLGLTTTQALADGFITGNALHDWCQRYPGSASTYVMGVVDTMVIAQNAGWVERTFCMRPNVTSGQLSDIACAFVEEWPQLRDGPAPGLISMSLGQGFPCQ